MELRHQVVSTAICRESARMMDTVKHGIIETAMKDAPVKVTSDGNQVTIEAFIDFKGDAGLIFPRTEKSTDANPPDKAWTYAEVAAQSIMAMWKGNFSVDGSVVNVETTIYSKEYSPNKVFTQVMAGKNQRFLKFVIKAGSHHLLQKFGMRSHEGMTFMGQVMGVLQRIIPGVYDGENILKWSVENSSSPIVVYDHNNNEFIGANWYEQTAAHEFGHTLGLGDAYNAGYRGGSWAGSLDGYYAPYKYEAADDDGESNYVYVPDDDIMLEGSGHNVVTDNDVRMVLRAYATGEVQYFPWGTKDWNDRQNSTGDVRGKSFK